jgi:Putative DNA-binding domain
MDLQWHPQVHRRWAKERLVYWRLGFFPTYDREAIKHALRSALEQHGILSYTCYELIGAYDLLLRVWVPNSESHDEVQESLIRNLATANLRLCDVFVVSRTVRHWVWGDGRELTPPDSDALDHPLPDDVVARIQDQPESCPDLVQEQIDLNLIGDAEHSRGIKFFLVVTASATTNSLFVLRRLEMSLIETMDGAPQGISERSLYTGEGFGRFLIMGRIPFEDYDLLGSYFVQQMNNEALREDFVARTYTHLAAFDRPLLRQDRLPQGVPEAAGAAAGPSLEDLLAQEESTVLEVKGSAFLDLNRLIRGDHSPNWDNPAVVDEILKTIVAFLNTDGGTLVVGALEAGRFKEADITDQLGEVPVVGSYFVVGVSIDYTEKDWDAFQRRLQQIIDQRIEPDATSYLRIRKQVLRERDMCVITVKPADRRWFYSGGQDFYVRQGNRTILLEGPKADDFRDANPRS